MAQLPAQPGTRLVTARQPHAHDRDMSASGWPFRVDVWRVGARRAVCATPRHRTDQNERAEAGQVPGHHHRREEGQAGREEGVRAGARRPRRWPHGCAPCTHCTRRLPPAAFPMLMPLQPQGRQEGCGEWRGAVTCDVAHVRWRERFGSAVGAHRDRWAATLLARANGRYGSFTRGSVAHSAWRRRRRTDEPERRSAVPTTTSTGTAAALAVHAQHPATPAAKTWASDGSGARARCGWSALSAVFGPREASGRNGIATRRLLRAGSACCARIRGS